MKNGREFPFLLGLGQLGSVTGRWYGMRTKQTGRQKKELDEVRDASLSFIHVLVLELVS